MKLLTLLLTLATGETDRIPMPAWECRQVQATMEQAWAQGGHITRDDGATVASIECVVPTFPEALTHTLSNGDCEMGETS